MPRLQAPGFGLSMHKFSLRVYWLLPPTCLQAFSGMSVQQSDHNHLPRAWILFPDIYAQCCPPALATGPGWLGSGACERTIHIWAQRTPQLPPFP